MKRNNKNLSAVDFFSGAGGLTLGLKRAGFDVVAAVEVDAEYAKTYKANHPSTKLLIKDIRQVTGEEILQLTGLKELDLVAGCPPCQGFSTLTSKYHRSDPRNELVLEMARLVEELNPKMVMMENVPGLANRGRRLLDEFVEKLKSLGYLVNMNTLQMADFGIPQSRTRFVLVAGRKFCIDLPAPTHSNKIHELMTLRPWLTLAKVIKEWKEPLRLSVAKKNGGPQRFNWHVVRDLKEISIMRLRAIKEGGSRRSLPKKLRPKCHRESNKGFQNVYGRLSWNETPPTITAGCTTPCKGRFGHPSKLRTLSVREAALIQTLPRRYKLATDFMETACDLVGNVLPPKFAEQIAAACVKSLSRRPEGER